MKAEEPFYYNCHKCNAPIDASKWYRVVDGRFMCDLCYIQKLRLAPKILGGSHD